MRENLCWLFMELILEYIKNLKILKLKEQITINKRADELESS
jgi:hypothetical protein